MQANKISLHSFIPEIVAACDGLSDDMAESFVRLAAIDFCQTSQVIRHFIKQDTVACLDEYLIDIPDDENLVSVYSLLCNGKEYELVFEGTSYHLFGEAIAWVVSPRSIFLRPEPKVSKCNGLTMVVATSPTQDACEIDKRLYDNWYEAIMHGALSKLYLYQTGAWYSERLALYHRKQFDTWITRAGIQRTLNYRRGAFKLKGLDLGV